MDKNMFTKKQEDSLKGHCNNSGQKSWRPNDAKQEGIDMKDIMVAKMSKISKNLH